MSKGTEPLVRNALLRMRNCFVDDRPEWALFTTFTFASSFFENNVLPLLAGTPVEELKGVGVARSELNASLAEMEILVVCDRSAKPEPKGDLRYGLLPVGLAQGRFHPKIMLMGGTLKANPRRHGIWLAVGSANLSLSGWALQREVMGITPLTAQHRNALLPLLDWLQRQAQERASIVDAIAPQEEGNITALLRRIAQALSNDAMLQPQSGRLPTLHLAWPPALQTPEHGATALLPALLGGERWDRATVVSPFWGNVDELVAQLGVDSCTFVPAPTPEGKFSFSAESIDGRTPSGPYRFERFKTDAERPSHAKAILLSRGNKHVLCTGSANFTSAAWRHGAGPLSNVEAVLRYEVDGPSPWRQLLSGLSIDELVGTAEDLTQEGAPPLPPFDADAACDWLNRIIHVRLRFHEGIRIRSASVEAAGVSCPARITTDEQRFALPFKSRLPVRSFHVRAVMANGETFNFQGLTAQLNGRDDQLGYTQRPKLSAILELLCALRPDADPRKVARGRTDGDGADDDAVEDFEPSLDYFSFFQGTHNLRRFHTAHREIDPFDSITPFGPMVLHRAIELQVDTPGPTQVARYVQLAELLEVTQHLNALGPNSAERKQHLCKAIEADLDVLRPQVDAALQASQSLRSMFPAADPAQRSQTFLDWFRSELKASRAD